MKNQYVLVLIYQNYHLQILSNISNVSSKNKNIIIEDKDKEGSIKEKNIVEKNIEFDNSDYIILSAMLFIPCTFGCYAF